MRNIALITGFVLALVLSLHQLHAQPVPASINYQGRLTDTNGQAVTGSQQVIFKIYNESTGGDPVWGPSTKNDVFFDGNGYFNVILGNDDGGEGIIAAFETEVAYLEITVGGSPILPRQQVLSAPYALKAFSLVNEPVGGSGDSHSLDADDGDPTDAVYVDRIGNVGIGTTSPNTSLHVQGSSTTPAGELGTLLITADPSALQRLAMGVDTSTTMYSWIQSVENATAIRDLALNPIGGNVGIGTTSPDFKLDVAGDINFTGSLLQNGSAFSGGGGGDSGAWTTSGSNLYYNGGHVGIGTTSPLYKLNIQGTGGTTGFVAFNNSDNPIPYVGLGYDQDLDGLVFKANHGSADLNRNDIFINRVSGNVGIGTTEPGAKLEVEFSAVTVGGKVLRLEGTNTNTNDYTLISAGHGGGESFTVKANGSVIVSGTLTQGSSREFKKNISYISTEEAMGALNNLNPVKFEYKAEDSGNVHLGFIAEDVPELVASRDHKHLSAMDLTAIAIKVIKEQERRLQEQQETISALAEKVKALEDRI